jgi:hypothetical protein
MSGRVLIHVVRSIQRTSDAPNCADAISGFWCIHGLAIEVRDSSRDVFYARAIAHSCF